ncbi:hypothetical protein JOD21_001780 [Jeotgalibacillus terrae]|nr:hypothetical protein [Jeotgalibacillus terrae]
MRVTAGMELSVPLLERFYKTAEQALSLMCRGFCVRVHAGDGGCVVIKCALGGHRMKV